MSALIDAKVLDELEDAVGAEFLLELIKTFLNEAPGMMAELQQAETTDDAEAIRRAAHSLKSNANTFGAVQLAEAARQIEIEGLGDTPTDAIAALQSALDEADKALRMRLDG